MGRNLENPCKIRAKPCPLLFLKPGKSPLFLGRSQFFNFHKDPKTAFGQINVGKPIFKVGRNDHKNKSLSEF